MLDFVLNGGTKDTPKCIFYFLFDYIDCNVEKEHEDDVRNENNDAEGEGHVATIWDITKERLDHGYCGSEA